MSSLFESTSRVVGTTFYKGQWSRAYSKMSNGDQVYLVREPDNPYDENAIAVCVESTISTKIGYIPRDRAAHIVGTFDNARKIAKMFFAISTDYPDFDGDIVLVANLENAYDDLKIIDFDII